MKRQLTVDFNRVVHGDLIRANARRAEPGAVLEVGCTILVGDDDWGVAPAEIVEYEPASGSLVLRVLADLEPEGAASSARTA